ncbi:MAG: AbrB/MazE/SpoVT family DNA-binding domain-containing protein [Candidatus Woesearchaeota archaeon]|jgi:phosphate uptake regulator
MRRKLVQQGSGTLMVSLPAKWIKAHKLRKGSEVEIEASSSQIILAPNLIKIKRDTEIKLSDLTESSIRTLITNTYRKGFDRITVHYQDEAQFKILKEVILNNLIGFEIINNNKGVCLVENITEPTSEQFEVILKKIFFNIDLLFDKTMERLTTSPEDQEYKEIENRIIKYDNFCRRIVNKNKLEHTSPEFFWTFLTLINHGQREIYLLNKIIDEKELSPKNVLKLLEKTKELYRLIQEAFFTKKTENFSQIHQLEKQLIYGQGYQALKTVAPSERIAIYHLLAAIRNFYQSNSPLLGLILD